MMFLLDFMGISYSNWLWIDYALFVFAIFIILSVIFYFGHGFCIMFKQKKSAKKQNTKSN
ncbi:hypothetical protein VN21_14170 [Paraclostridium benzoelyticum]|uniref:Uncharacterized protein n=1 Tax=Paraclostridium benzoelyticum TaxID=1629550 RepID=A0A0M3DGE6_9FIRM|nr:hypothetical protein VN21_14170 [Paraclostridium benzoelyticum]